MNRSFNFRSGFTIIELSIIVAVLGLLMVVAIPQYQDYQKRVDITQAVNDINAISMVISDFLLTDNQLPADLAAIGMNGMSDPWGNPYQYVNHQTAPPGKRRKDKNLVPINSDFDLCSMGEDGASKPPLTVPVSKDDIIRANDGGWVGKAENY